MHSQTAVLVNEGRMVLLLLGGVFWWVFWCVFWACLFVVVRSFIKDSLTAFYVRLYNIGCKSERRNPLPPLHVLLFSFSSEASYIRTIAQTG